MRSLRQALGGMWPDKGVVRPEQYDKVKKLPKQAIADLIGQLAHSEQKELRGEES